MVKLDIYQLRNDANSFLKYLDEIFPNPQLITYIDKNTVKYRTW